MDDINQDIIQYYKSGVFHAELPDKPSQHVYLVRTITGGFRRISKNIRSQEQLAEQVTKLKGVDVYYSTARWLKPTKIKQELGNPLDMIMLDSLLCFDIDPESVSLSGMGAAQARTRSIVRLMARHADYKLKYIAFSGRGFQLVYKDTGLDLPTDFKQRPIYVRKKRKLFIVENQLEKEVHSIVTINPMAVIRLIGTANSRTGFICTKITESDLLLPINELLNNIPYVTKERPVIPGTIAGEGKETARKMIIAPRIESMAALSDRAKASRPISAAFVSSKVLGTKDKHILVLRYNIPFDAVLKDVFGLILKYRLPTCYILELEGIYYVVCLKTFQIRRMQKMINNSKSNNRNGLKRFKQLFAPFSIGEQTPTLAGVCTGYTLSNSYNSHGHSLWLESLNVAVYKHERYQGRPEIKVYKGVLR